MDRAHTLADRKAEMNQVLYQQLLEVAKEQATSHYKDVAPLVALDMANADHRNQMSVLLEEICRHEHDRERPLLSVVVVHARDGMPGSGFFLLAEELGLFNGGDRLAFFAEELRRVHEYWGAESL